MTLLCLSLSHHTAPVGAREAVVSRIGDLRAWLRAAADGAVLTEAFVVSTCHRFDLYVVAAEEERARSIAAPACGLTAEALAHDGAGRWRVRMNAEAAVHLARVAAGLDSLIVGEAEIAGQVRRAAALAREAGSFGQCLEIVLAGALRASGRARSETKISAGVMSAASAAIAKATAVFGSLEGRHVLVIGAGQAAQTALGRLVRRPVGRVSVASRSRKHAEEAAAGFAFDVCGLDDIPDRLCDVDVLVAATHGGQCLVTRPQCEVAFGTDPGRQRILVDLSVPRVIDPDAATLPGVVLWSVDDLGDLAAQSRRRREQEIPVAETIALEEGQRAFARLRARRRAAPVGPLSPI